MTLITSSKTEFYCYHLSECSFLQVDFDSFWQVAKKMFALASRAAIHRTCLLSTAIEGVLIRHLDFVKFCTQPPARRFFPSLRHSSPISLCSTSRLRRKKFAQLSVGWGRQTALNSTPPSSTLYYKKFIAIIDNWNIHPILSMTFRPKRTVYRGISLSDLCNLFYMFFYRGEFFPQKFPLNLC